MTQGGALLSATTILHLPALITSYDFRPDPESLEYSVAAGPVLWLKSEHIVENG